MEVEESVRRWGLGAYQPELVGQEETEYDGNVGARTRGVQEDDGFESDGVTVLEASRAPSPDVAWRAAVSW